MPNAAPTLRPLPRLVARVLALAGLAVAAASVDAASASAQMPGMFGNMPELAEYRLTVPTMHRFIAATQALKALEGETFDLEDRLDVDDPSELTLDRLVSAFEREPRIRTAIQGAGIDTREYVTFMMAMVQTAMGAAMLQMGGEDALSQMPAGVMKDNIQFFLDNHVAFEALQR